MRIIKNMCFSVAGAKSCDGENTPNWAYIDSTTDAVKALELWELARDYPINEFELVTFYTDGSQTTTDLAMLPWRTS